MKILVTGGAGFIGSHLTLKLVHSGHDVTVLDNLSTGSKKNLDSIVNELHYVEGSVLDKELVLNLASQVDTIYHLAAAVGVRLIVEQPVETISINIAGTENILAAALAHKNRVILASTSEVYGKSDAIPFVEDGDMLLGPTINSRWSYACSKAIDEFLALAYWKEKKIPVTILRLFNTIGPRQVGQYGMVVPRFVQQALSNEPITVYGDGKQTRVFCDVEDVVEAMLQVLKQNETAGEIFNLGGEEEIAIFDLAQKVKSLTSSESKIELVSYDQAYQKGFEDLKRRIPNINKAKKSLQFKPKVTLEQSLNKIIDYYKLINQVGNRS